MSANAKSGKSRRFNRKEFLRYTAAGTGAMMLGGCTLYSGGSGVGEGGSTTIRFVHWRGEDSQVFDSIIQKFQEENSDIRVEQTAAPSSGYEAQLQSELQGAGGADVFATFPGSQFANLADADVYADLGNVSWRDNFQDTFIEAGNTEFVGMKDGRQLTFPYQVVFNIPVSNVGMMESNGINPDEVRSWDAWLQMCETLKQAGVAPILFPGADDGPGQFINPMLMNNQPSDEIWSQVEAGEAQVTEDWFVKTLSQIKELADKGYFQKNSLGTKKEGAAASFAQEKGAMLAMGSYLMASVKEQNPDIEQGLIAPITVPEDQMKYEGIFTSTFMLGVNKQSKNQEQAKKFIEFLTQPEIAAEYANGTGQLLSVKDVSYETEVLKSQEPWLEKDVLFQPRYKVTKEPINEGLQTSVQDVVGGMSPEEAAKKLQGVVDRAVQG